MTETRQQMRAAQRAKLKNRHPKTFQHAHKIVAHVAKACANEFYEGAAHSNAFYDHFPDREAFVAMEWHNFIQAARGAMAQQLADPRLPESAKDEIFDALTKDRSIPRPDNAAPSPIILQ